MPIVFHVSLDVSLAVNNERRKWLLHQPNLCQLDFVNPQTPGGPVKETPSKRIHWGQISESFIDKLKLVIRGTYKEMKLKTTSYHTQGDRGKQSEDKFIGCVKMNFKISSNQSDDVNKIIKLAMKLISVNVTSPNMWSSHLCLKIRDLHIFNLLCPYLYHHAYLSFH